VGITILGLSRVINGVVGSLDSGRKIKRRIIRRKRYVYSSVTIVGRDWIL